MVEANSMTEARVAVHPEPVWRDRSNIIVTWAIDDRLGTDISSEQLWARWVDDRHFELCCIPFFADDLALGDVVETDSTFRIERVSVASGRFVFRVYFNGSGQPKDKVTRELAELGALLEWYSAGMLVVDARDLAHAQVIADFLRSREDADELMYESGKTEPGDRATRNG